MKKKYSRLIILLQMMAVFSFSLLTPSCEDNQVKETTIAPGDTIGIGQGYLLVVNATTNDTIRNNGGLKIIIPHLSDVMNAKHGDKILMTFVPDDRYAKLPFTVRYTLLDETEKEVSNNGKYEFTIPNLKPGNYKITWNAFYRDANHNISGGSHFYIVTP